jgi:hypothetical protein
MQKEEDRLQRQQARRKQYSWKQHHANNTTNTTKLISRLSADEITSSRAFSTAVAQSKRPSTLEQQKTESTSTSVRHFNTSRALKSVNDSSTIDLTFLPEFEGNNSDVSSSLLMRVPILPDTFSPARTSAHALEPEAVSLYN